MIGFEDQYRSASTSAAWADRSDRLRLRITGPDGRKYLHNLTTNDIKRLPEATGREAFVTTPQGKALGLVTILPLGEDLLLRSDPGTFEIMYPHLAKYGVFDDVHLSDETGATVEYHVVGPEAERILEESGLPRPGSEELAVSRGELDGFQIALIRERPAGRPGWTIIAPADARSRVEAIFSPRGIEAIPRLDPSVWECLRIEAGTPVYGRDVAIDNLPQEIARDERAISFVKGCYLGQETVARLDALGHVNRLMRGFRLSGDEAPPPGSELEAEGKVVGKLTSATQSPGWKGAIALGFVRTAHAGAGQVVRVRGAAEGVSATVMDLPMIPDPGS